MNEFEVVFHPIGKKVVLNQATTILDAADKIGIQLAGPCGGNGKCGKCKIRVVKFPRKIYIPPDPVSRQLLSDSDLKKGQRLACTFRVFDNIGIEIPSWVYEHESYRSEPAQILVEGWIHPNIESKFNLKPIIKIIHCQLPKPSLDDNISDLERLRRVIFNELSLDNNHMNQNRIIVKNFILKKLPNLLRNNNWNVDVILSILPKKIEIQDIRPGNVNIETKNNIYGIALDIGTSTIVAYLINLLTGEELAVASDTNPQVQIGTDLITRIRYTTLFEDGDKLLTDMMVSTINKLIKTLCTNCRINKFDIFEVVAVGNTTMLHSFLGLPISNLGNAPYIPLISGGSYFNNENGLEVNPNCKLYVGPMVSGFMGADAASSALIANLFYPKSESKNDKSLKLVMDIGTNGEILLGDSNRILGCSAAAGPAFEGNNLRFGMRALPGAVYKVNIRNKRVEFQTIGDKRPIGITGSGVVDSISEFIKSRAIKSNGNINLKAERKWLRYQKKVKLKDTTEPTSSCDLILPELCIVPKTKTGLDTSITITQSDIREIQLAKAAIRTGIEILTIELGAKPELIDEVYLAGAFGNYIKPSSAVNIKLLPKIDIMKIKSLGNSAGSGAKLMVRSKFAKEEVKKLAKKIEYIDLATHAQFQDIFIRNMDF